MRISFANVVSMLLLMGLASPGYCVNLSTTNMKVTATVASACTVATLPLMFKQYNPLSPKPLEAQTLLTVRCSQALPYVIRMNAGLNNSGKKYNYNNQAMSAPNTKEKLHYNIFTDPTYTHIWGDGATNGSVAVSGVGTGTITTIPAYGRILAGQKVSHGQYEDTVTITIIY